MAAGPTGQWASVIFVAAQVHTRVRFLFLSFSISLTIRLISHYISNFLFHLLLLFSFFFSTSKNNIYIFPLKVFSDNICYLSLFFFNFHLSSLYLTMIFLSLININFYLLFLSASVLPQTDNPTAAHQMLQEGVFNPLP